ncbi:cell division protein ZipA [Marinomonas transparens]|uniref:Cell division protein ZipA n=1 Tax=Marinomonas transparens TaxID=2795388 RepID=A0A934JSW0_9GAMM|nr:cell division protein ZipA [Marinomonas transparens]MBJ7536765.1 cell division protein ZipA [Marinomonas transparens]
MEFSLREWLILIGVVIIVVILIDGFRRYKKTQLLAQADDDFVDPDELVNETVLSSSDPSPVVKDKSAESIDPISDAFENARKTAKGPLADLPHKVDSGPALDRGEEMHLDELASLVPGRDFGDSAVSDQNYSDHGFYEYEELDLGVEASVDEEDDNDDEADLNVHHDDTDYERSYSSVDIDQVTPQGILLEDSDEDEEEEELSEIEEVIVINIFAPEGQSFPGMELLQLILNCGMRYGDMDIFHRHEDGFDRGRVQFSMANAIEPGTFDLDTMGEQDCPGVSFFMGLPGPKNSMKAFDFMLETSQTLVRNLGGELRDERRSPMSDQTIAHCRQRIRDFERRRLTKRKPPNDE